MIKFLNWVAALRPTPRDKRVPSPDVAAAAAQLREIAESLAVVVAAGPSDEILQSIGIVPPAACPGAAPPKPQPSGGRIIRGDVDPGPVPSPPAPSPGSKPEPMAYWVDEIAASGLPVTLLGMVADVINDKPFGDEPRAVLLIVAKWLRFQGAYTAANSLEREAGE